MANHSKASQRIAPPLHRCEQGFEALVLTSPDSIVRFNGELRYVYVNPAFERDMAVPARVAIGKTNRELGMSADLASLWDTHLRQVLITGQEVTFEFQRVHSSDVRQYQTHLIPEGGMEGTIESVLGITRDITAIALPWLRLAPHRQQAGLLNGIAQHIRQSQNLQTLFNQIVEDLGQILSADRVLICRFDPDWRGEIVAEAARPIWAPLLGSTITDPFFTETLTDYYQQGHIQRFDDVQTANLSHYHLDLFKFLQVKANLTVPILPDNLLWGLVMVHRCQQTYCWQDEEVELIQQVATHLAIAVQQSAIQQELTQLNTTLVRKVHEQTILLQQALKFERVLKRITDKVRDSLDEAHILQTAVREMAVGLSVDSCDTRLYNADRTTSTIRYEYTTTLRPCQGLTFRLSETPDPMIHHQLLQGQYSQFCFLPSVIRHAGRKFVRTKGRQVSILVCPLFDGEQVIGDLWLYKEAPKGFSDLEIRVVQQVTNQCAIALRQAGLYKAAQNQVQELERLNRLKDDFLSTVSHELRTPMSNIQLSAQMLESILRQAPRLEDAYEQAERYFQILQEECEREINLIDDLLDLSRLDADSEPLLLTPIDVGLWVPHIAERFIERSRTQQQILHVEIPTGMPFLTTDTAVLARILTELLNNACKYTPAKETIQVTASAMENSLALMISNSGVDIPPTELERIFEKFYRIPNNDPWKHSGTGLGLALVKKLTEYLGGTIHVTSEMRVTTFTVIFPLIPPSNPT